MAWAEKRRNGRWRAGYRDRDGDRRFTRAVFISKPAALTEGWSLESRARLDLAHSDRNMTWSQWHQVWWEQRRLEVEDSTLDADRGRVRKWIAPRWDGHKLSTVRTHDVRAWVRDLERAGNSAASVHKIYHLFSASLKAAVQAEVLGVNPCRDISLPTPDQGHERYLTHDELAAAAAELVHPYSTTVLLLAETGLRFGEFAGLHWQRVFLDERRLDVIETWSRAGQVIKPYPKGRLRRSVPLSSYAAALLEELSAIRGQSVSNSGTTCGHRHSGTVRCRSSLVLPSPQGHPLDSKNMRERHWLPALERAGIDRARQHDLRHTYASWLAQAGVSLSDIAEAMGHSDTYITQRYRHLADSHLSRIRDSLDDARRRQIVTPIHTESERHTLKRRHA